MRTYKNCSSIFFLLLTCAMLLCACGDIIHWSARTTAVLPKGKTVFAQDKILDADLRVKLQTKFDLYNSLITAYQDKFGFIMVDECDSLLFSSLLSATGKSVDITQARDKDGYWHRRPTSYTECWQGIGSDGSTISRDMFTGLFWHLFFKKDLTTANELYAFAKAHGFVMGQGDISTLILMPGLEATLAEMIYRLGGINNEVSRNIMQSWPEGLSGYEVHLLLLHSLLRGEMMGENDGGLIGIYEYYREHNPCNPLCDYAYHLYTNGNMNSTAQKLLDEKIWPSDRLPRRKDRFSDWVTQRACGRDWEPSQDDPEKEFTGGDFLFTAWLVLK